MRRDNTDIAAAEQQIRELEDALRRDESALDSLNAELTEQHGKRARNSESAISSG